MLSKRKDDVMIIHMRVGECACEVFKIHQLREVIRHNDDGTRTVYLKLLDTPVISAYYDPELKKRTFRNCYLWMVLGYTGKGYQMSSKIKSENCAIPCDDVQYNEEDVTDKYPLI